MLTDDIMSSVIIFLESHLMKHFPSMEYLDMAIRLHIAYMEISFSVQLETLVHSET